MPSYYWDHILTWRCSWSHFLAGNYLLQLTPSWYHSFFLTLWLSIYYILHFVLQVHLIGCLVMGIISFLLLMEHSPPLYHAYTIMTSFLWIQIVSEYQFLKALWKHLCKRRINNIVKLLAVAVFSIIILEFLVRMLNTFH